MKLAVAVLALLCLGMGANANNKNLGVKVDKTDKGLHVDLPDITVPKVSMPEVNVAVEVKKPTISATKIDLPDFTIPTKEITIPTLPLPEIDLSALTALLSKGANSSASLAGFLKKSDLDLSALQNAVNGAMQIKTALTADAAAALQTMATAVYQAKYNVTSKIADLALEVRDIDSCSVDSAKLHSWPWPPYAQLPHVQSPGSIPYTLQTTAEAAAVVVVTPIQALPTMCDIIFWW